MLKRNNTPINWVDEESATKRLGYTKQSLRALTTHPSKKDKWLPIRVSIVNRKTRLYSGYDIEQYINSKIA